LEAFTIHLTDSGSTEMWSGKNRQRESKL